MSIDQIASVLWRRRVAFLIALLAGIGAIVAITVTLPKTYSATATLYVGGRIDPDTFVDTSRIEQQTRTYATLAGNPNVAERVAELLPMSLTRSQLLRRMSFAPVERTPLIQIAADGPTAAEAQLVANTYAAEVVDRMNELFEEGRAPAEVSVSEDAALPTSPAKPNPPLYIGLGTLLSLILALGVVLARERLDTRVRVAPEDDTLFGQPIMARIPRIDGRDRTQEVADRFGLLKTNLDFFDENPARVVLVTSPGVGEGKSTVAANLALACAADGERVVLVEGDLRRPGLDTTVVSTDGGRARVGLSNYLAGAADEEQIVSLHADRPNLAVVWSGLIPPNPSALLGSHRLDTLLGLLRLEYDRVIIDTCPISIGPDASVIASRVDGALYVVDERSTKDTEAIAGLNQLRNVRARMLGIVLNRATSTGAESYYYSPGRAGTAEARPGATESFS